MEPRCVGSPAGALVQLREREVRLEIHLLGFVAQRGIPEQFLVSADGFLRSVGRDECDRLGFEHVRLPQDAGAVESFQRPIRAPAARSSSAAASSMYARSLAALRFAAEAAVALDAVRRISSTSFAASAVRPRRASCLAGFHSHSGPSIRLSVSGAIRAHSAMAGRACPDAMSAEKRMTRSRYSLTVPDGEAILCPWGAEGKRAPSSLSCCREVEIRVRGSR